jgi:CRISPR-associated exonuclease Cas4
LTDDPSFNERRGNIIISRAVPLVSYTLGLFGVADVVEFTRSDMGIIIPGLKGLWLIKPVEYKRGKPKIDERDEVQLCAQVLCLEEMFSIMINEADFFYHEIRRRQSIKISQDLRTLVKTLADDMHDVFNKGITPKAEVGKRCSLCSLVDICVPKLTKKNTSVQKYIRGHVREACIRD